MFNKVVKALLLLSALSFADWGGKTTEPQEIVIEDVPYYNITSPEELAWFSATVNGGTAANAILANDIVMGADEETVATKGFTPIGSKTNTFVGVFDGAGYTIYGLKADSSVSGLFGYVGVAGVVKNVNLKVASISHSKEGGAIAGNNAGLIQNVSVTGIISSNTEKDVGGGIVGRNKGQISNASTTATVSAQTYAGGIAGYNEGGTINGCFNSGKVSVNITAYSYSNIVNYAGGIAAYNSGTISQSGNTGSVSGASSEAANYAGGLVAKNDKNISDCYNSGSVSAYSAYRTSYGGGLVGLNSGNLSTSYSTASSVSGSNRGGVVGQNGSSVVTCFYDVNLASSLKAIGANSNSATNVVGKTTAELKTAATAWELNTKNNEVENRSIWSWNNGYPYLADETNKPIYRLTFNDGITDSYVYSTYLGVSVPPKDPELEPGDVFLAWVDKDGFVFRARGAVTADKTYYAEISVVGSHKNVVTFVDGKNIYSWLTTDDGILESLPESETPPEGYEFLGWYISDSNEKVSTSTVFTSATTIVAKYAQIGQSSSLSEVPKSSSSSVEQPKSSSSVNLSSGSSAKPDSAKYIYTVNSKKDLPKCDDSAKERFYHATEEDVVFYCDGKGWVEYGISNFVKRLPDIQYRIAVTGRNLQISGAPTGASVSVFNTLGKAVYVGKVGFNNMGVQIPQSGTYIVRVGKSISKIEIR